MPRGDEGPIQTLVMDFDGVILESNEVKSEVFAELFARYPEHEAEMTRFHQENAWRSRFDKLNHLVFDLMGRPHDVALRDALERDFSRLTRERLLETAFVPGAWDFLAEFAARVPIHLASITPIADLDWIVERRGLRPYFRAMHGFPPTTKAAAMTEILRHAGHPASAMVMIGDAPGDLASAREVGAGFLWRRSRIPFDRPPAIGYDDLHGIAAAVRPRLPREAESPSEGSE